MMCLDTGCRKAGRKGEPGTWWVGPGLTGQLPNRDSVGVPNVNSPQAEKQPEKNPKLKLLKLQRNWNAKKWPGSMVPVHKLTFHRRGTEETSLI